ncbi:CTD small phosphatase-like protein [Achlya hypogyna]|uniref:CTD small phosphatase-like protein n=1 Tax=Achlya hypogyna TaxID=1202772 RepID=A0A1V9YB62_ACHHY|nr:CTD small phosphatase-like protein [Achlya hypogyna]
MPALKEYLWALLRKLAAPQKPSPPDVLPDIQTRLSSEAYAVISHLLYNYSNVASLASIAASEAAPIPTRLAVVLDLDECLVHTQYAGSTYSYSDTVEVALSADYIVTVNKRPGVDAFLCSLAEHFDVYLFTSSEAGYANPIVDMLDPTRSIFRGRFFYDACVHTHGLHLKDLRRILPYMNQSLSHVILVDNNPISFLPQPRNGIPLPSFLDDAADRALPLVLDVLLALRHVADVRPCLDRVFHLATALAPAQSYVASTPEGSCSSTDNVLSESSDSTAMKAVFF